MSFLIHLTIALISLIAIVLSCILFTNAIEFLGNKMKLGNNATGSILAVIGTGLPETIIPIVAILGAHFSNIEIKTAQEIATGAILGSCFMLSTLALFLLFLVLVFKKRKVILLDHKTILRDYKYFILAYSAMLLSCLFNSNSYKIILATILIILYFIFVYRTVVKSRTCCIECECEKLYFKQKNIHNENFALFCQLSLSLLILVLSSHFFVNEIKHFSNILNISPAILSLLITPFATELPEIINSIIWLKQNKDDLAFANVLGAIVFQATLLFSMGMLLTPWVLSKTLIINSVLTLSCALLIVLSIIKNKSLKPNYLIICGITYLIYLIYILI